MKRTLFLLPWVILFAALLLLRLRWRSDALFWDEFCYVGQARFIALHGLDRAAYHTLDFVRPPVFTGLLAGVIRAGLPDIEALRVVTCLVGLPLLVLVYRLARALGGGPAAGWSAVILCAASPLYLAQIGLVLSDVPASLCATGALIALVRRRMALFMLLAALAVWVKESAYFVGVPCALIIYLRGPRRLERAIWRVWPAAVPALALAAWLLTHRYMVGVAVPKVNNAMLGPTGIPEALLHDLIEGRLPIVVLAGWLLVRLRRGAPGSLDTQAVWAIAAGALALPFVFPGPLLRYMMLSLPLFCALGGLQLESLDARRRTALLGVAVALLALGWSRPSWHNRDGHHLDDSLAYRALLSTQVEAVRAAHTRGHAILAAFPLYDGLLASPHDRFPPPTGRETVTYPSEQMSDEKLCAHDLLIDADQGNETRPLLVRLQARGAATLVETLGEPGWQVRIYRVACGGQTMR